MSRYKGAYNGGIRSLDDLKGRCVIDDDTNCWHLRDSLGRALKWEPKKSPGIFVHGVGKRSARRAAWGFSSGTAAPEGCYIAACECAWDCVNPEHLRTVTPAQHGAFMAASGKSKVPSKAAANMKNARQRAHNKLTVELAQWARESEQSQVDKAHALGVCQQRISEIERWLVWKPMMLPQASVFGWRPQA